MKILVYGSGPLGSLFAAKLGQSGNDVSILARGQRLADLREYGIVLEDWRTKEQSTTRVNVVEQLASEDAYDLVLVIMRKNNALDILPVLTANRHTPNVAFMMNNAAGPGCWIEALGKERVLIGFPSSAGYRDGHVIHYVTGTEDKPMSILLGEVDGQITERTRQVAQIFDQVPGWRAEIRSDMDTWHRYHVALLMPSLAPALYACGTDNRRLARTRDAVTLAVRAIREGFRVLQSLSLPVTPSQFKFLTWLPEPVLVPLLQHFLADEQVEIAMVRHANAARDEIKHLTDEFLTLARPTGVPTPAIDRLYPHLDPQMPLIPDGSAEIPLDWRPVWAGLAVAAGIAGVVLAIAKWLRCRDRQRNAK